MRKSSLIIVYLLHCLLAAGQLGNEWINPDQSYFKFKITEEGFYRVEATDMQAAGFPISTVAANRIQLFRRGQELAISAFANPDGTLNYFEFYGTRNDGLSDAELYNSGGQPNPFYNLFSDSASYFITYRLGNDAGKRMAFSADKNAIGLTPEAYHLADTLQIYSNSYAVGERFGPRSEFSLSSYEAGEGWTGSFQTKNVARTFEFSLQDLSTEGPDPFIETTLVGGNSLNHNIAFSAGPNESSLNPLASVSFAGWGSESFSVALPRANVGAGGLLTVQVVPEGSPGAADRAAVSYFRLQFPQLLNLAVDENKVFTLDNPAAAKAWLQINTTNASGTRIFDITDPYNAIRLATSNFSQRVEAVVPNATDQQKILAVTGVKTIASIKPVDLPAYDFTSINYTIITHPDLRTSGDPIEAYKAYRESVEGGSYEVLVAEIEDLYNLYGFGDPTTLAIRRFLQDASNETQLEHAFLIGKGFTPNFDSYRRDLGAVNIPTYGYPGSDLIYTFGLNGADQDLPGIGIGRLNARTPADVDSYLAKIQEMEALPYNQLFRKDFLQLSGGANPQELTNFAAIVQDFTRVLEGDFVGGKAYNTGKSTSEAVEFIDVTGRINQGVGYVTFFGHSSGSFTDIEIGRVSDPQFGFSNKGKYPVFLVNGCKAGEIFGTSITFGEDWITAPDLGAVAFMAHSDVALSSGLKRWSDFYYELSFADDTFFGASVGTIITEISRQYKDRFGTFDLNKTQIQQMTLQGDPAYRMFGADHPDYEVTNDLLEIIPLEGSQVLTTQDSFQVQVVVKNYGRTVSDSLIVQLDRIFPNGEQESYARVFAPPLRQDTLQFYVPLDPAQIHEGTNLLTVTLDPTDLTQELNEVNNQATLELSIFSGNTVPLFPIDNGLRSETVVDFVFQSSDLLEEERSYDLEIDNSAVFDGVNKLILAVSGKVLISENIDLSGLVNEDTTTIYWRTRFTDVQPGEVNEWVSSSFTIIGGVGEGWGQFTNEQTESGFVNGVSYNEITDEWEFKSNSLFIDIGTFGANHPSFSYSDLRAIVGGLDLFVTSNDIDRFCEQNTFNAIVFDRESGDPYKPVLKNQADVFNREVCGRIPQRIYQYRSSDLLGSERRLQVLVDNMQTGDIVVLFSIGVLNYSSWDADVVASLNELGIDFGSLSLTDGQPLILFGKKGDPVGSGIAITSDGTPSPSDEQAISLQTQVNGSFISGQLKSRRIGPARSWTDFSYEVQEEIDDVAVVEVNGIDANGSVSNIFSRARIETIDLAAIDPVLFPELELVFDFSDQSSLTPPQFNYWEVQYELPPEGILQAQQADEIEVREGEEIAYDFDFVNISAVPFSDSLNMMARLVNPSLGTALELSFKIAPPPAKDTTSFQVGFPSFGRGGTNSLIVEVTAGENEMYTENNRITLPNQIQVNADETNPILDVTFDGIRILDGDVVSPNPVISIKLRDDNPFLSKSDTAGVNISLKLPGEESQFQRISFSDPRLNYFPADENSDFEVEYKPGPLENGRFAIRVQAADEVGNEAGEEPYEINFEVVNESTITHFYPYPNPFSTSCRFVFTLTGSAIPDQIKIQILTVSGRVVREITQEEIGPIRIGNNITSYAWDGRDEFGDQLANGVYFYKVFINADGRSLQRRSTAGDGAFKNGFGKLYILR